MSICKSEFLEIQCGRFNAKSDFLLSTKTIIPQIGDIVFFPLRKCLRGIFAHMTLICFILQKLKVIFFWQDYPCLILDTDENEARIISWEFLVSQESSSSQMTQLFCLQWGIISITTQSTAGKTSPRCGPTAVHFFTRYLSTLLTRYNQNNYFTFVNIQFLYMLQVVNSGSVLLNLKKQSIHRLFIILSFLKHSPASKVSTTTDNWSCHSIQKTQEESSYTPEQGKWGNAKKAPK